MVHPKFIPYELKLVTPDFDDDLTDLIIELDHLRRRKLEGTTHPQVFFQLKHLFHTLESIGSARIEGNNTTIAEYIETTRLAESEETQVSYSIREIMNIEKAMEFIEEIVKDHPINKSFISELHQLIVKDLPIPPQGEGDKAPGQYRSHPVKIAQSNHIPPAPYQIDGYMDELIQFLNNEDASKYDLLKIAIAHHRFVWIHPFGNGNGRTVRLFTYALLIKNGFNLNIGRIVNPTAVFCNDRNEYYEHLALADSGTDKGIKAWCQYVLKGLKEEIEKIDKLLDYDFLKSEILIPAINYSLERKVITDTESKMLKVVIEKQVMQNVDLEPIFKGKAKSEISRQIKMLQEKKMLTSERDSVRKYVLRFDNNYLLRAVIHILSKKGFLPLNENL
ncbi:MAG TPA: Fic family protein [Edaphocola sp.]|nr:Fic family protein [Edaphocola sp.]